MIIPSTNQAEIDEPHAIVVARFVERGCPSLASLSLGIVCKSGWRGTTSARLLDAFDVHEQLETLAYRGSMKLSVTAANAIGGDEKSDIAAIFRRTYIEKKTLFV